MIIFQPKSSSCSTTWTSSKKKREISQWKSRVIKHTQMQQRENQRVRRQNWIKRFFSWIPFLRNSKMLSQKKISMTKYSRNKTTHSMPSITQRALWMRLTKSKTRNLWMSTFQSKHYQTTGKCSRSPLFTTLKMEEIPKNFARQRRSIWSQLGKALFTQMITD